MLTVLLLRPSKSLPVLRLWRRILAAGGAVDQQEDFAENGLLTPRPEALFGGTVKMTLDLRYDADIRTYVWKVAS